MSDSWRITVKSTDLSSVAIPSVGAIGAMVLRASKGPSKPVLISRGDSDRIKRLYGEPSVDYPDVWEAMQFLNESSMWVSAPFPNTDTYGGIVVSSLGSRPLDGDMTFWPTVAVVATADVDILTELEAGDIVDGYTLLEGDRILLIGQTDESENGLYVAPALGAGAASRAADADTAGELNNKKAVILNGTYADKQYYTTSTVVTVGTDPITFEEGDPIIGLTPAQLNSYEFNATNDYFILTAVSPMTDDLGVKISYNVSNKRFTINLYKSLDGGLTYELVDDYIVSLYEDAKDDFGKNIFIENIFEENDYIQAVVNEDRTVPETFVNDTAIVAFGGGSRTAGSSITTSELTEGWNYFQQKNKYKADIFMDNTCDPEVVALFDTLSQSYQKYASYIFHLPLGTTASAAVSVKEGYSLNNPNIAIQLNHAKVRYKTKSFWTSLVGRVGQRYAAMRDIYNGLAPSWVNENNHGGQLGSSIIEMEFDPSEDLLENLDTNGINCIVFDDTYGVMITSHKTAQTATIISDYSYIPHVRVFNYIKENVITQVLTPQATKLNDDTHREIARIKAESIVNPLVTSNLLAEAIIKCDEENNNDEALSRREFHVSIGVKVTPFSERLILNFINVGQTSSVSEAFAS